MKPFQFFLVCVAYVIFVLISVEHGDAESIQVPPEVNCNEERYKTYSEDFYMQMGLCKKNLTVLCMIRPSHPCFTDQSRFKVTAFVAGNLGRCLIEGNVTARQTLRFYIEAKRIKHPNQAGSRSLGAEKEKHQRGKCMMKYICNKKKIRSISLDCGSVIETSGGKLENFTRRKLLWTAPKNYKGVVYFSSKVLISADRREVDISTAKIMTPDDRKKKKSKDDDDDDDDDEE